jgi:hypothetical protein
VATTAAESCPGRGVRHSAVSVQSQSKAAYCTACHTRGWHTSSSSIRYHCRHIPSRLPVERRSCTSQHKHQQQQHRPQQQETFKTCSRQADRRRSKPSSTAAAAASAYRIRATMRSHQLFRLFAFLGAIITDRQPFRWHSGQASSLKFPVCT